VRHASQGVSLSFVHPGPPLTSRKWLSLPVVLPRHDEGAGWGTPEGELTLGSGLSVLSGSVCPVVLPRHEEARKMGHVTVVARFLRTVSLCAARLICLLPGSSVCCPAHLCAARLICLLPGSSVLPALICVLRCCPGMEGAQDGDGHSGGGLPGSGAGAAGRSHGAPLGSRGNFWEAAARGVAPAAAWRGRTGCKTADVAAIIMGSDSDLPVMKAAAQDLGKLPVRRGMLLAPPLASIPSSI